MTDVPHTPSKFCTRDLRQDFRAYHARTGRKPPAWSLHPADWQAIMNELSSAKSIIVLHGDANMRGFYFDGVMIIRAIVDADAPQA